MLPIHEEQIGTGLQLGLEITPNEFQPRDSNLASTGLILPFWV
jgi:hypothetical protein